MKVKDLIKNLEAQDPEKEVVIRFMGGLGGSTVDINAITPGIDFNQKKICIHPQNELTRWEWYRDMKKAVNRIAREYIREDPKDVIPRPSIDIIEKWFIDKRIKNRKKG